MIKDFIVCSFVTKNSKYVETLNKYLIPSLEKLSLPYHIEYIDSYGSWIQNTSQKPSIILKCMEQFTDKNILYLDCDSIIKTPPILFNNISMDYDLGLYYLDVEEKKKEVISGVMFVRNNIVSYDFIKKWKDRCVSGVCWEQRVLGKLLKDEQINVYELPIEYCYILSLQKRYNPNPVIVSCPTVGEKR
jgi:hypothetical protein